METKIIDSLPAAFRDQLRREYENNSNTFQNSQLMGSSSMYVREAIKEEFQMEAQTTTKQTGKPDPALVIFLDKKMSQWHKDQERAKKGKKNL